MKALAIAGVSLLVVLGVVVGILGTKTGSGGDIDTFPMAEYTENPQDYFGNRYTVEVVLDRQTAGEEGVGRVLAVRLPRSGSNVRLPVVLPDGVAVENIQPEQRYIMDIVIKKRGLIYVERMEKY